jgi:hypothetical protein
VTNSGYFGSNIGYPGGAANVSSFTNSTFTGSTDPNKITVRQVFRTLGTVTFDTIYTDGVIVLSGGEDSPNVRIRNVVIRALTPHYPIDMAGTVARVAEFDRVLRITDQQSSGSTGYPATLPGGNLTRLMGLMNAVTNPHFFSGPGGIAGQDDSIDGAYFEKIGAGVDGDQILGSNTPATLTTIKNTVTACSTTDGYAGSLSSQVTGHLKRIQLLNNTYCGKDDGGDGRGFGFEVGGTELPGSLAACRNNIVFCATNVACYLVHQGPTGTASTGTFANVDYNWRWNVATGPYLNVGTQYSPNPPGAHDSSGDPQFVQQRHFLDWGQMLKSAISNWTDIVAEFAKMNDDVGYDPRFNFLDCYNWLRAGYVPRNAAVYSAGDTGGQVGAMNLTPSMVAGPEKIAGPGAIK